MQRADLYLLNSPSMPDQIEFCCRLCEKAFPDFERIHIHTHQSIQNEALDTALWSFKADSFLPHDIGQKIEGQRAQPLAPILIDQEELSAELFLKTNLLIVLNSDLPANAEKFDRVCILVINHDDEIKKARLRYKDLKQKSVNVLIHDFR